jgi:MHS family proline/betaine transporter-like MFS transporter
MSKVTLTETRSTTGIRSEVWIGWFSSLVEAYNIAIYSFTAPFIASLLFKESSAWAAIILSYLLVFAGSGIFYPLGAMVFGFIGDKQGRRNTCVYSALGLAIATGMMGLVPIDALGSSAWMAFLFLLCAQYFFSGGEYYGSVVFSLEHAMGMRSGLMSALSCLFAVFGLVAANGMSTLASINGSVFLYKMCFLAGGAGGIVSYLLKNYCQETPVFASLPRESLQNVNWIGFIRENWKRLFHVVIVVAFFIVSYSYIFIFLPLIAGMEGYDTFNALIAYGVLLVGSGMLADKLGLERIMAWGLGLFALAIIPLTYVGVSVFALQLGLTAFASMVIGPIHSWMLTSFHEGERCRGIFLASAISISLFNGSTVPLCLYLYEVSGSMVFCSLYPLGIAVAAIFSLATLRNDN